MITDVLALGGQPQPNGGGSFFTALLPFILIFAIMYFLMIRPQQKKQKELQAMLNALKKGDRVVTTGGIHGTVVGIKEKENIVVLKVASDVNIEVSKGAVSQVKASGG